MTSAQSDCVRFFLSGQTDNDGLEVALPSAAVSKATRGPLVHGAAGLADVMTSGNLEARGLGGKSNLVGLEWPRTGKLIIQRT